MVQSLSLLVTLWELQSFLPPQTGDLLVIDHPAFNTKQAGNLSISVSAILLRQPDHRQAKLFLIILLNANIAVRTPGHANRFARSSLGCVQNLTNMKHSLTQIGNRQALGFR